MMLNKIFDFLWHVLPFRYGIYILTYYPGFMPFFYE